MTSPILITGCSSGLGRATALALLKRGHVVYATARRVDSLSELATAGAVVLALDVTNDASMAAAVGTIESTHGAVGTLINNAGYAVYGAVENTPLASARAQFETNVFGLARLTQLVLPGMRAAGRGRIVNVSSVAGRFSLPASGWYHASKHAVEALSDALRAEVAPHGIDVVLIEPGVIATSFLERSLTESEPVADGPYQAIESTMARARHSAYSNPTAHTSEYAAQWLVKAAEVKRPRHRYVFPPGARITVHARRLLGSRAWDWLVARSVR